MSTSKKEMLGECEEVLLVTSCLLVVVVFVVVVDV